MATAEQITEKEMRRLERKVSALYRESAKELRATVRDYWASYSVRLNDMQSQLAAGEITQDYYAAWVRNNVGRGQRWEALRDDIAKRAADTNQIAAAYVNDTTPGIYSLNANRAAYTIQAARPDIDFALVDEQAVKNLARGNNQFEFKVSDGAGGYTYRRLQPNYTADYNWNSRQIERQLTLGILRGDGPKEFTERFLSIMGSNLSAAIRNARTSITSAHNAGTMHTLRAARDMGINVKKQWLSTSDGRTRDSHVQLNGEQAEIDDAFPNGCLYPADPAGEPAEVYNCRCTMVYVLPDVSAEPLPEQETPPESETEQQTESGLPAATFENTQGITKEFARGMAETLEKCEYQEVKDIFSKYQDKLVCLDDAYKFGAHFDTASNGVRFNAATVSAGLSYKHPYQTAFHEFGHMIDHLLDNDLHPWGFSSNYCDLLETMRGDFKAFKQSIGAKKASDVVRILQSENMTKYERGSISDMLEKFANTSYPLGIGHGQSYHKKPGATEREFFAEVLEGAASCPESLVQLQRVFPNAVEKVFEIIREDLKQ